MPQPESIEDMLSKLMPVAISDEGQDSMNAMLDELMGGEPIPLPVKRKWWKVALPAAGIAAAAAFALFRAMEPSSDVPQVVSAPKIEPDMVLVGESNRIEAFSDEGWVADPHGSAMQAVRVRAVEESMLRDERTGIVFSVSEPREEMILYPVSSF